MMNLRSPPEQAPRFGATRYYAIDGVPVVWRDGELPKSAKTGSYFYDLDAVALEATPISRDQFERLLLVIGGRPAS